MQNSRFLLILLIITQCKQQENDFTLDDIAERVYVIRRNLGFFPLAIRTFSHSALLIKSKDKQIYTIVEYMEDSKVYYRQIWLEESNIMQFCEGENTWKKQKKGTEVTEDLTIGQIINTMTRITNLRKYGFKKHNCHIAQESTRFALNLVGQNELSYPEAVYEIMNVYKIF